MFWGWIKAKLRYLFDSQFYEKNTFLNVPGFSIHYEIELISKAGMSNTEILKSGSVNPARYFGEEEEWGVIKAGASADFVLVQGNRLEDLATLKNPIMVVMKGRFMIEMRLKSN
ncbi:Amidohydrolase family protein [Algoriphagus winogradskyi]|uniref:Amidohydrolase family protein n=1 Tax=Algoriphagus winogradskyi TaxID=237017 RepID=A0ABY1NY18_9BACT|nr:Amidohydrolase family protein [Algoriphagus winogradskyi]